MNIITSIEFENSLTALKLEGIIQQIPFSEKQLS